MHLKQGGQGALMGAGIGAMTGTVAGFKYAHDNKVSPWTGESNVKGNYSVYQRTDADGNTKYVGITERDPQVRFDEHQSSGTERAELKYEPVESGLTKTQARIMEQNLINQYGMQKNGGSLYNQRNSIAPKYWGKHGIKF